MIGHHASIPANKKIHAPEKMNLVFDNYEEYLLAKFFDDRRVDNKTTITETINLDIKLEQFISHIAEDFVVGISRNRSIGKSAQNKDGTLFICFDKENNYTKLNVSGDPEKVMAFLSDVEQHFPSNPCFINWVYDPQYFEKIVMPLNIENMPIECMYPFLYGESLASYYDRFVNSSANILILIGPPGTGKTTFIRGLLAHAKKSATLSYNHKVIEQDGFFVEWYESKDDFMILEDSDSLLIPRKDGNDMMARFLNLGDGLMSIRNKKLIFSTNLPHIADIDEALTRPGRCHDIIEFTTLSREQAQLVADATGTDIPNGNVFSLSDIFASKKNSVKHGNNRKFGFI